MTDETRNISINVQATNAIKALTRVGEGLSSMTRLVGSGDTQLAQAEKQLQKYGNQVQTTAGVISKLKSGQTELAAALRSANTALEKQNKEIAKSQQAVTGAKETIKNLQRGITDANKVITQQAADINKLKTAVTEYQAAANKGKNTPIVSDQSVSNVKALVSQIPGLSRAGQGLSFGLGGKVADTTKAFSNYRAQLGAMLPQQAQFSENTKKMMESTSKANSTLGDFTNQNVALRYALYSTATTFGIVTAFGIKAFDGLFNAGIQFEKNIAGVLRTSQVESASTFANSPLVNGGIVTAEQQATLATQTLQKAFLDLESSLPITQADLTTIGTLGSQMGIAAQDIVEFTKVTAEFSAVTGIGANEAATGLARIGQLMSGDVKGNYEALASAILKTGVNSIATEQQILNAATNIASIGHVAGLSAKDVIALASGMSSLGITSELQRSVVTQTFSKILVATNRGAAASQKFGDVLGITGQEFINAFGSDAYGTFTKLTGAIANGGNAIATLQKLGLASQRLTPTLLKIGQQEALFKTTLADTTDGWNQEAEVQRQFQIIASTTAAKIQVLQQAWDKFLTIIGGGSVQIIGGIAKAVSDLINGLSTFAASPLGSVLSGVVIVVGLLATGILALATFVALAGASLLGLDYVIEQLGIKFGLGSLSVSTFGASLNALTGAAFSASTGMAVLRGAMALLLNPVTLAIAAIGALTVLTQNGANVDTFTRNLRGQSSELKTLEAQLTGTSKVLNSFKNYANSGLGKANNGNVAQSRALATDGFFGDVKNTDEQLAKFANKNAPEAARQLTNLEKAWVKSGLAQKDFKDAFPDSIAALALQSNQVGATVGDIQSYYQAQQDAADATALATIKVEAQANAMGLLTSEFFDAKQARDAYVQSVESAGSSFLDITSLLTNAYGTQKGQGGGLTRLQTDLNAQLRTFKDWANGIQTLTAKGAGSLAQSFVQAGPASQQAVTDALKLSPSSLSKLNQSMRDAAFFASQAFADAFANQNAVLADVYTKTLAVDPKNALAALHAAQKDLGATGNSLTPEQISALNKKFGITIDVVLNDLKPEDIRNAEKNAQAAASAIPVTVPFKLAPFAKPNSLNPTSTQEYGVTENGHSIVLKVSPDTKAGTQVLDAWRANQYEVPVEFQAQVDTTQATKKLLALKALMTSLPGTTVAFVNNLSPIAKATGGGIGIPGYADGGAPGYLRGPGTDTSDSILARLSRGEYVNTASSVRYYGADFFDALNRRSFPRFATGGAVGSPNSTGAGATMNINVVQNYPTTVDPIKKLKIDAENLVAGLWS